MIRRLALPLTLLGPPCLIVAGLVALAVFVHPAVALVLADVMVVGLVGFVATDSVRRR